MSLKGFVAHFFELESWCEIPGRVTNNMLHVACAAEVEWLQHEVCVCVCVCVSICMHVSLKALLNFSMSAILTVPSALYSTAKVIRSGEFVCGD